MEIIKWTTEFDGYSVGDRLLDRVMFAIDVELNLEKVKEHKTFFVSEAYTITNVRPSTPQDESYLKHIGGDGAVTHWCDRVKSHASSDQTGLMTDEIFLLPEIQKLWKEYER